MSVVLVSNAMLPREGRVYGLKLFVVGCVLCTYGLSATLFSVSLRPERILALLLSMVTLPLVISSLTAGKVRKTPLLLALWLLVSLISSAFALDNMSSLRHWFDLTLAVSLFFFALHWRLERLVLSRPKQIMRIGVLLAGGGLIMFILQSMGLIGADSILSSFVGSPYGYTRVSMTMLEPNLYGATMMIFALAFLSEWKKSGFVARVVIVLFHIGMLLSFSRAPLVGYAVGVAMYFLCKRGVSKVFWYLFAVLIVIGVLIQFSVNEAADISYLNRVDAIESRVIFMAFAWRDILNAPFIGNGVYSFGFLNTESLWIFVGGEDVAGEAWLGSLPLAVLHDSGIIGFLFLGAFFVSILRKAYRSILEGRRIVGVSALALDRSAGWLSAGVAILISSVATTAHSMGVFWVLFAIIYIIPLSVKSAGKLNTTI